MYTLCSRGYLVDISPKYTLRPRLEAISSSNHSTEYSISKTVSQLYGITEAKQVSDMDQS